MGIQVASDLFLGPLPVADTLLCPFHTKVSVFEGSIPEVQRLEQGVLSVCNCDRKCQMVSNQADQLTCSPAILGVPISSQPRQPAVLTHFSMFCVEKFCVFAFS